MWKEWAVSGWRWRRKLKKKHSSQSCDVLEEHFISQEPIRKEVMWNQNYHQKQCSQITWLVSGWFWFPCIWYNIVKWFFLLHYKHTCISHCNSSNGYPITNAYFIYITTLLLFLHFRDYHTPCECEAQILQTIKRSILDDKKLNVWKI